MKAAGGGWYGARQFMAGSGRKNADEAQAIALASGQTLRDAAAAAGISERTAARRWADDAFRCRIAKPRAEMMERTLGLLVDGMAEGAEMLRALLKAESESVRLGAARSLVELPLRVREHTELEERLRFLEYRMAAAGEGYGAPR
jgi:hypothetical protein